MIANTLTQAAQIRQASAIPLVVKNRREGYELVSRYETLSPAQKAGLAVVYEWHRAFNRDGCTLMHPMQFEIYGVAAKDKGTALANELRQLGLLQHHEGRYQFSPAGLKLVLSINEEEC
ncbi:MAG: hypothetical protein CML20_10120 [Rheinheimera sp.]|uniref:hypothetical protein n=1 Tax=Arsukibacterium sp. UBA3155 TaxID=1946058 RepID=UPI000C920802|nr:hypothetical protein [Arsukibacterium sp. UBA3155]MAD75128.1 hypothetical protein [Rheinheimera sp.]|tara:strand:+ start:53001 stop:53357 length:357 start_codon:yes stop_codon:yes gene_type:complete